MDPSIISDKLEEGTVTVKPTYSASTPRGRIDSNSDVQSEIDRIEPLPSRSMILNEEASAEKWKELTRVATEHDSVKIEDPTLDPTNPEFDVCKWANMVLRAADKAGVKFRRASFTFKNLIVSGSRSKSQFQMNVASIFMAPFRLHEYFSFGKKPKTTILKPFDGVTKSGELLLVLGRPGSGCSTFLKSMAGELHGLIVDKNSTVHYNGIPQEEMIRKYKGEIVYNSEVDKHFPHLTVRQTLEFAATMRTPRNSVLATSREEHVKKLTSVAMAICGLSRIQNTKVGNDFVRGVSGGERKRVSIAEMILASSSIGFWDNSTRGLDSATALEFVRALRTIADIIGSTHAVAIYQASQAIYDVFDKVILIYEGREIYFGPTHCAKAYFQAMGWYCPPHQTTGDFLTSVQSQGEKSPPWLRNTRASNSRRLRKILAGVQQFQDTPRGDTKA